MTGDLVVFEGYTNLFGAVINIAQKLMGRTRNHKVYHVGMIYHSGYYIQSLYGRGVGFGKVSTKQKGKYVLKLKDPLTKTEIAEFENFKVANVGKEYETNFWEFASSILDWFKPQKKDTEKFFCSELVAEFFIQIGRLPDSLASNEYTPQDIVNSGLWIKEIK